MDTHPGARPSRVRLVTVERTGSTNADLRRALSDRAGYLDEAGARAWPHLTALRAVHQVAGRGRTDHDWSTPPTGALTVSYVLRPRLEAHALGWVSLLAGLAVRDAIAPLLASSPWLAATKWPNDVVVAPRAADVGVHAARRPDDGAADGAAEKPGEHTGHPDDGAAGHAAALPGWGPTRKIAGVLTEIVPNRGAGAPALVVGVGVNLAQGPAELPVPWAASLASIGAALPDSPDALAVSVGERLGALLTELETHVDDQGRRGAAPDEGLRGRLEAACSTLGREVAVSSASGTVRGTAVGLEPGLRLRPAGGGPDVVVTAGDVLLARLETSTE